MKKFYCSKQIVFVLAVLLVSSFSLAAQDMITGVVSDEDGTPVNGATVQLRNTNLVRITDDNGAYSIEIPDRNAVLVFAQFGYITQEINVGNQRIINIALKADAHGIEEMIVVGYGTMQKKQVTSAVTSLSSRDLPMGVGGSSIATALQGKVPGLIMSGTDSPNSGNTFQLRGMASINTSRDPLIVIDGMPGGDIRSLSREEIQSIDVLKDASAGAIYGTRATGGVILITTKKGSAGRLTLSYTGEAMFKTAFGKPDMLNAKDYIEHYKGGKNDYGHDTDWWDEALNTNNFSHRHVVSINGGVENMRVFAMAMYEKNEGVLRGDSRKDYSGRINGDFRFFDGWLDISTHVNYRQALRDQNKPGIETLLRTNPTQAVRDPNSITGWNIWTDGGDSNPDMNEIGEAALKIRQGLDKWFRPDVSLKLNILPVKGLSYTQTVAYENRQWENHEYNSSNTRSELLQNRKGWAKLSFSKTELLNIDGYFSYVNNFRKHSISATAGYSYFERNGENFNAENMNFTNDKVGFWNIGEGSWLTSKDHNAGMGSGKDITQRLMAYFARANYSYNDTYMAMASIRHEGSSKFAANKRWGTFWALSAGWRISREGFMDNVSWVNDLKLRAAYGITGNEGFSADYAARMFGSDTRWLLPDGTWAYSYGVTRNINPELGWEEKREWNVGLDFSVLDNRIWGSFDWYRRKIHGLIYNVDVPQPPNTETKMYKNIGTMRNLGWEIVLGADVVRGKKWHYTTSVNISHNTTKVGELWGDNKTYYNGDDIHQWIGWGHRIEQGAEVGPFHVFKYAGVSDDGEIQVYNKDGEVILASAAKTEDRRYMKSFMPKAIVGWSHSVGFKNWSLDFTLTSWIDYDVFNAVEVLYGLKNVAVSNMTYDAIRKNDKITGRPAATDYFIYDGTFVKLQNLTLAYTLPMQKYTRHVESIRMYFTGNNLFRITKYPGLNPEVDITGWNGGIETAGSIYPQTRTFTLGVQLTF